MISVPSTIKVKIFILFWLVVSCKHRHNVPPEKIVSNYETINEEVKKIIYDQVSQFGDDSIFVIGKDTLLTGSWISDFYERNNYLPVWTDKNKLTPAADSLINVLASIESYGLKPQNYSIDSVIEKIDKVVNNPDPVTNVTRIYEINILLTDIFFRLSLHLKKGIINEKTLLPQWKGDEKDTAFVQLLRQAFDKNNIQGALKSMEPRSEQYILLRDYLGKYLKVEKDLLTSSNKYYADDLNTNDSLSQRISQLMVNMERFRWEKERVEDYYLNINLPSYTLQFYACGIPVMNSKVIVGKPETPTPFILDSKISFFYVYPYWFVPFSIATKEILPILKRDTSYLVKNNMEILDKSGIVINPSTIRWKKYSEDYFPFIIRQRDGDENTLGVLKFIFSNKYGIYLHDTNSHSLFTKEYRALSHGCIRLEKAKNLAELISKYCVINFTADSLEKYVSKKERKKVDLSKSLPIHIRYFTAVADSAKIYFYDDVYSIDKKMKDYFESN